MPMFYILFWQDVAEERFSAMWISDIIILYNIQNVQPGGRPCMTVQSPYIRCLSSSLILLNFKVTGQYGGSVGNLTPPGLKTRLIAYS